ncbi:MAG: bifunctional precorrin-2 dehydrogenase/sirohydrochlorin ferrochelatase [Nitrospirae bacterium YQR-1]
MDFYPIFVSVKGKKCIVLGGGDVGQRKVITLTEAGADVTVISPALTPVLELLRAEGKINHIPRLYKEGDLTEAFLVIAATDDISLNNRLCENFNGLINVAGGDKEYGNFIVPSTVNRGALTFAISTQGISPALAKTVKEEVQTLYSEDFAAYLEFLKEFRHKTLTTVSDSALRRQLLSSAGGKDCVDKIRAGCIEELKEQLCGILSLHGSGSHE